MKTGVSCGRADARHRGVAAAVVAAVLLLGGCSTMEKIGDATASGIKSVASALNPLNWFGDDEPDYKAGKTVVAQKPRTPGTAQPAETHPSLSSVPDRPRRLTSSRARAARKEIRDGLAADAENARHTDEALRAGQPDGRDADSARSPERAPGADGTAAAHGQAMAAVPTVTAPAANATAATQPSPQETPQETSALRSVQVATIYFADGSASLTSLDRQVVRQVAEVARRTGGTLRIVGHSSVGDPAADPGRRQSNFRVSLKRANAVAAELRRNGVPVDQMQVSARGDSEPVYLETAATGAAGNRRAEVYLDYFEGT